MSTVAASGQVIQLDSKNEGGIVTVTPRDGDRYNLKVGEVFRLVSRSRRTSRRGTASSSC